MTALGEAAALFHREEGLAVAGTAADLNVYE